MAPVSSNFHFCLWAVILSAGLHLPCKIQVTRFLLVRHSSDTHLTALRRKRRDLQTDGQWSGQEHEAEGLATWKQLLKCKIASYTGCRSSISPFPVSSVFKSWNNPSSSPSTPVPWKPRLPYECESKATPTCSAFCCCSVDPYFPMPICSRLQHVIYFI